MKEQVNNWLKKQSGFASDSDKVIIATLKENILWESK